MNEKFQIGIRKVCPACKPDCPNFQLDYTTCYAESFSDGRVASREYFCANAGLCEGLWSYLCDYKERLEEHN